MITFILISFLHVVYCAYSFILKEIQHFDILYPKTGGLVMRKQRKRALIILRVQVGAYLLAYSSLCFIVWVSYK